METNRLSSLLLSNLKRYPISSPENDWVFQNQDESFVQAVQISLVNLAQNWIATQPHKAVQSIAIKHASIQDILGDDLTRACISFLGPDPDDPFWIPVDDHLSSSLRVNKAWNSMATETRYKYIEENGIMLDEFSRLCPLLLHWEDTHSFARTRWTHNIARCLARLNLSTLYIPKHDRDFERFPWKSIFGALIEARRFNKDFYIHKLMIEDSCDRNIFSYLSEHFEVFKYMESISLLPGDTGIYPPAADLHEFLKMIQSQRIVKLRSLSLTMSLRMVHKFDDPTFNEIPYLLPRSIEDFCVPRTGNDALPSYWVSSVISHLPHLKKLTYCEEVDDGNYATWFDEMVLDEVSEKKTMECIEVIVDNVVFGKLVEYVRKWIVSNPNLKRIVILTTKFDVMCFNDARFLKQQIGKEAEGFEISVDEAEEDEALVRWVIENEE